MSPTPIDFESRRKFHTEKIEDCRHLNNALIGIVPPASVRAMTQLASVQQQSSLTYAQLTLEIESKLKQALADLIKARSATEIAMIQNTSTGISLIANGFLPQHSHRSAAANLVILSDEYPSNREIWLALARRHGLEVRMIKPPLNDTREEALMAHCDHSTVLLAISAVQFTNGYQHNLAQLGEFCRKRDIFFMVDAIQACGVIPIDAPDCHIDALVCGGHKWLMTPEGVGFMWVNPNRYSDVLPVLYGWRTLAHANPEREADDTLHSNAQRFESGTQPQYLMAAMEHSLSVLHDLGISAIQNYLYDLKMDFISRISSLEGVEPALPYGRSLREACYSSILSIDVGGGDRAAEFTRLLAQKDQITVMTRAGRLRISPHIYNDKALMGDLALALNKLCRGV